MAHLRSHSRWSLKYTGTCVVIKGTKAIKEFSGAPVNEPSNEQLTVNLLQSDMHKENMNVKANSVKGSHTFKNTREQFTIQL
jgi:hypothetical protein